LLHLSEHKRALCKWWYRYNWSWSRLSTLSWDSPDYHVTSPRPSFHNCCYDICTGWYLYSPWLTCIQVCCRCVVARRRCSHLRNTLVAIIICMTHTWIT
jgi:hypothetical protein